MTHVSYPKTVRVESEPYRRLVASLPCIHCGIQSASQCAHPNSNKAKGAKADDRLCFPLCHVGANGCHRLFDLYQLGGREYQSAVEPVWAARTQALLRTDGSHKVRKILEKVFG